MADIRPDRHTTCQSERKSVVSRRPSVQANTGLNNFEGSETMYFISALLHVAELTEYFNYFWNYDKQGWKGMIRLDL
jgi:hypothetical protein